MIYANLRIKLFFVQISEPHSFPLMMLKLVLVSGYSGLSQAFWSPCLVTLSKGGFFKTAIQKLVSPPPHC